MSETGQKSLVEFLDGIEQKAKWRYADKESLIDTADLVPALVKALRIAISPPQCPWPADVWVENIVGAGERMRAKMGDADATAISGVLMRHGWELAIKAIVEAMEASVADSVPARTESAPASE